MPFAAQFTDPQLYLLLPINPNLLHAILLRGPRGLVFDLRVYFICTRTVGWHVINRHRAERKIIKITRRTRSEERPRGPRRKI